MDYSEFKEKVKSLKIPWEATANYIYCPLYMNPIDGFSIQGTRNFYDFDSEELSDIYKTILRMDTITSIVEDGITVEVDGFKIMIKTN